MLLGDATLFPQAAEVGVWLVLDPMEDFWSGQEPAFYRAGEWGPRRPTRCWRVTGRLEAVTAPRGRQDDRGGSPRTEQAR